ncbi:hypothetical protein EZS27_022772 [termite gut metagenome]|uniref:Uncharacterized protein n=1 Tax=termite gut metagenome TaxID=433724 RepID=A0A5J4R2C3_9ZZZZ
MQGKSTKIVIPDELKTRHGEIYRGSDGKKSFGLHPNTFANSLICIMFRWAIFLGFSMSDMKLRDKLT